MSKEQIEEMSIEIREVVNGCSSYWSGLIAEHLYEQDYRKQKEGVANNATTTAEWISVEDRLPPKFESVLVCCNGVLGIDFICSTGKWYESFPIDVTHWMPFPEAPKMKGGAEE